MTYPKKDKYKSRHIVQKGESKHERRQPRYPDAQRRVISTMNNKPRWNAYCTTQKRTSINNRRRNTGTNQENLNKETRSNKTVEEKDRQSQKKNRIVYIDGKIYVPRNRQL